jgi:hypothetical protein
MIIHASESTCNTNNETIRTNSSRASCLAPVTSENVSCKRNTIQDFPALSGHFEGTLNYILQFLSSLVSIIQ